MKRLSCGWATWRVRTGGLGLPFSVPFFGAHLNLLPCLMTGFTLIASMLQTEASLSPDLMRQQRIRLYLMAAAFFLVVLHLSSRDGAVLDYE